MIQVLVKLNDVLGAEKCFNEGASNCLNHDIHIMNTLVRAYLKEGFEKAKVLQARALRKGSKPNAKTWEYYLDYYLKKGEIKSVVDCVEKEISTGRGDGSKLIPSSAIIGELTQHFVQTKDVEGLEAFLEVLKKSKDEFGLEVLESLIRTYAAAGKKTHVMRRPVKKGNVELSIEGLVKVVSLFG